MESVLHIGKNIDPFTLCESNARIRVNVDNVVLARREKERGEKETTL